ncbi:DNA-binding NarL/FixJ family response regulator [Lipingzhangella halophila]|uniref:DNA-binding NarL/FixJ family response regulator n=1 Tax=Lipingzhangella halophila TaxID=1783352 RepID=A0A7W7W437_9ACTN|nr:response regulator transcription factor [Lipingzhangella halophila]MBB4933406.1 DNA-binding NarL/FixJ family response regulator [Lipingzhangella halophila]
MIRVLLVDDHPLVREGVRAMLSAEDDLEVVGEAASSQEAVTAAESLAPDVVLMDLRMPGGDGVGATERILRHSPDCRVLVLTTYDTDTDILRAVEAGAAGYLLKDTPRAELAQAVRTAMRGETVLAPAVAGKLVSGIRERREAPQLTEREVEVLRLAADGCSNAEIGRKLFISGTTVKTHLMGAYTKLDVSDRTAAVTKAMRLGLLSSDGPE